MANPLILLRQYNVNKKEILQKDGQIILGEFSFPKNTETNCLMWGFAQDGTPKRTPKEYYTLECLVYLLKNISLPHPEYVKQASADNIQAVKRPDRKGLLAYLKGQTSNCPCIDKSTDFPTKAKRSAGYPKNDGLSKRSRLEDPHIKILHKKFADKFDTPKEVSVPVEIIKSLSDAMSEEKIAAIKAKRLAKKQTAMKGEDEFGQPI